MTMLSDLPDDLVEEILSRVLRTCLGAVRSTCKLWNNLSKNQILCKAEARHQFLGFTMIDERLYSMRFNLQGIGEDGEEFVDPSIKPIGNILNQVKISKVFYCDGLLLCVTMDHSRRLVVWNPYLGQTRWIQPRKDYHIGAKYALGYDNNKHHKILRFFYSRQVYEIYDLKSNSWSLFDATPNWVKYCYERGVSLNGNTYFMSREREVMDEYEFILCFDFTTERIGQIIPLPFGQPFMDTWTLSCVRGEKLAVLNQYWENIHVIEIWVTIKIEPNAASWSKFLRVDMEPPTNFRFAYDDNDDSFFIDEEKKVAVVLSLNESVTPTAYIIGDNNRYLKTVDLEKVVNSQESVEMGARVYCFSPLVCSSSYYVPSLVQINQLTGRKRKQKKMKHKRKDEKRKRTNKEEALAIKGAGKSWYQTTISDSDYTEFDNFTKWVGASQ